MHMKTSRVAHSHYCYQFIVTHLELALSFHQRRKKTVCRAVVTSSDPPVVDTANNMRQQSGESLFSLHHI